eukprot:1075958-Rhodomonas_salina.1
MDCQFFIPAAEALLLVNNKFDYFVNHPNPDVFTNPQFKKAVITYMVAHGFVFRIDADHINPSSDAKFLCNYKVIIKVLKVMQLQLSDSCAETFESIFTTESLDKHPLKPLCVWKRMKDSVHKVAKDRCSYMTSLQHHAGFIESWELDDVDAWIKSTEILRQDLLRVGYTESITDDCIVGNLLNALKSVPNCVQHCDEWKFPGMSWKIEQAKNHSTTWLILKSLTRMEAEIVSYCDDDSKDSGRARKKPKVKGPISMALLASQLGSSVEGMTALSAQFNNDKPHVRTRADKAHNDCQQSDAHENSKTNTQFGSPKRSSMKPGTSGTTPKTPGTPRDSERAPENSG